MNWLRLCTCCDGRGVVPVTGVYADTLDLVAGLKEPRNGASLAVLAGCKAAAMYNRLTELEKMGLVQRRQHGREAFWSIVRPAPEQPS